MSSLRIGLLGFLLGVVVAVAPSCGAGACNAMNCSTGCCDSMGKCQAGTTPSACGKGGAMCGACAPGQACTLQICGGPMGMAGGSAGTGGGFTGTGGGAAGGGAMDAGCMDFGDIDLMEDVSGSFNVGVDGGDLEGFEWWDSFMALEAPMMRTDTFLTEFYFETVDGPPMLPYAGMLATNTNYVNCTACFQASLGCDDNLENCAGEYLATSGGYNFTAATRNVDAGVFIGEGTNLVFRKWNFTSDRPDGTACFTVGSFKFRAVWPDPPAPTDAGATDGGATDAGLRDAGVTDAGSRDGG